MKLPNGKPSNLPQRRPSGSPGHLKPIERTAILDDYLNGMTWRAIALKHNVDKSAIANIRNAYLVNEEATVLIKQARLPKLYEVSEWVLDTFGPEELEKASLRERGRLYGTLQDKINQIEGVTGNINIAIATVTDLGLLDK
ncbi:hypothetical protein LCGC14_0679750 [marine sediment metagenome]|uniref:Uncharacterized protein n=1 Tax=marine sediment metagenome TaxID=412755 RepID=A0A0F9R8S2_9ZZZZ